MVGPRTDGVVTIRPPQEGDALVLIAGRDAEWERWLGPGDPQGPRPTACIVVDDEIVGWVDFDTDAASVRPGGANVGYNVFAAQRRKGYATRALRLLLDVMREETDLERALLLIAEGNAASIGVARALGAQPSGQVVEAGEVMLRYVIPLREG
jgi:predicted acetyltransferase